AHRATPGTCRPAGLGATVPSRHDGRQRALLRAVEKETAMSASCTTNPAASSIRPLTRGRWRSVAALIAVVVAPAGASAQILDVEQSSMTSYLAGATGVQDLRPRAMQRAVHLDGSGRAGDFFGAVAPGHAGSHGGYNRNRTLSGQLDLGLGAVMITEVDMALPAEPGGGWVVGRSYNARQDAGGSHHVSGGPMGNNWATSIPEIVLYEHTGEQ